MFCAEFEMNYKDIGVIIIKKCCVSAYAKVHISILKMRKHLHDTFKELIYEGEKKEREKDEKNQTVDSNGVSDCYGNVSICMRVRQNC